MPQDLRKLGNTKKLSKPKALPKLEENSSKIEIKPLPLCAIPHENQSQPQTPRERPQARNGPLPPCRTQNPSHPARHRSPPTRISPHGHPHPQDSRRKQRAIPIPLYHLIDTTQKTKPSIKDFLSKGDQIRSSFIPYTL